MRQIFEEFAMEEVVHKEKLLLLMAMEREKAAFKLYTDLATITEDENLSGIFTALAQAFYLPSPHWVEWFYSSESQDGSYDGYGSPSRGCHARRARASDTSPHGLCNDRR